MWKVKASLSDLRSHLLEVTTGELFILFFCSFIHLANIYRAPLMCQVISTCPSDILASVMDGLGTKVVVMG